MKLGKKPYTCEKCKKSFAQKRNLEEHERRHRGFYHVVLYEYYFKKSGEKPYKCEHCSSNFADKKTLKTHEKSHTGCYDICYKQFFIPLNSKISMVGLDFDIPAFRK